MAKRKQAKPPEPVTLRYRADDVGRLPIRLLADTGATLSIPDHDGSCEVTGPPHVHETLAGNGVHPIRTADQG